MFSKSHQSVLPRPTDVSADGPSPTPPGVLVVDDAPALLCLLKAVLLGEGYVPFLAPNGTEAIALYERHRNEIGMVLLDVRMPGLDGPQTLAELRRFNPDVACCFMSGFSGGYSSDDFRKLGSLHLFEKPFAVDEVGRGLRQLLASGAG